MYDKIDTFFKRVENILDLDKQVKYKFSGLEYDKKEAIEKQLLGLNMNLVNELDEYFSKGILPNKEYEKVDAVLDMLIYTLNAVSEWGNIEVMSNDEMKYKTPIEPMGIISDVMISKYNSKIKEARFVNAVPYFIHWLVSNGYNPYGCILECLKEVTSRKAVWNEQEAKFKKLPGYYSKNEYGMFIVTNFPNIGEVETIEKDGFYITIDKKDKFVLAKGVKWYKAEYSKYKTRGKAVNSSILKEMKELQTKLKNQLGMTI